MLKPIGNISVVAVFLAIISFRVDGMTVVDYVSSHGVEQTVNRIMKGPSTLPPQPLAPPTQAASAPALIDDYPSFPPPQPSPASAATSGDEDDGDQSIEPSDVPEDMTWSADDSTYEDTDPPEYDDELGKLKPASSVYMCMLSKCPLIQVHE